MADIETTIRRSVLEIDLLNSVVIDATHILDLPNGTSINQPIRILPDIMERFKTEVVGDTFHMEGDELQHVIFYSDDTAIIQRKKLKYDFATDSATAVQYIFNGATTEQILALKARVIDLISASRIVREKQIQDKIVKISEEKLFYDAKMNKRLEERKAMLKGSDWRVLPDIEDSYEGEKEMWKKWRKTLREMEVFNATYEDSLDFFKALHHLKWPIDPSIFRQAFPDGVDKDGNPVEYLGTDDQWTKRDIDASKDYVGDRMASVIEWRDRSGNANRNVASAVQDLMKLMRVEDFVENGIDYSEFYDEADINDLATE
jgi:hypothetical protein